MDKYLYALAAQEFDTTESDQDLYLKSLVESDGDAEKARLYYIRGRAKELEKVDSPQQSAFSTEK